MRVHAPRAAQVVLHARLQFDLGVFDEQATLGKGRVLASVRRDVRSFALGHGLDGALVKHGAAAAPDEVGLALDDALRKVQGFQVRSGVPSAWGGYVYIEAQWGNVLSCSTECPIAREACPATSGTSSPRGSCGRHWRKTQAPGRRLFGTA